ncbi:MAG: imidazole glycerol phosphate synthase subunit HisH [bacterium]|nr:imidazole glycerol phosphate synthase subunit HisH [bacterium]
MSKATVIDAGIGNLDNLARALRHVGAECEVTTDAETVATSRCLVLPGVGAFRPPREALRGALEDALRHALDRGAWLLGICVGYQLLFERGEEFGVTDGLGLLPGTITRLPGGVPLPHIGWNALHDERDHPLFEGVPAGSYFYFVHSFAPLAAPNGTALALTTHGARFVAVAGRDRVMGTQFHPEKSGAAGLRLLANFLGLSHAVDSGN